ncbi:MAG: response regulator [Vicinamibacterales bacterium]
MGSLPVAAVQHAGRPQILIADDDRVSLTVLAAALKRWDFDVLSANNGMEAWALLLAHQPAIVILDWMMPDIDGPDLCRRIRAEPACAHTHVMLLTSRNETSDLVQGLEAGADDYLAKPFNREELKARVDVGIRVVTLQRELNQQIAALQEALAKVTALEGLLPICSYCKRIRSDAQEWEQMESYISTHSSAQFSHSVCPSCLAGLLEATTD